ncbi:hypothetical protein BDN70DRAFT_882610 [Pholiota conissans]|uniref:Uncharacterized protein n=1 Tax=Pholiota conissans TaxID=109636 RepID=A0A9P5YW97_9AGAR|nr:hypothetical protein BDN70DRAFT_882610 [Pholiota conissans]
MLDESHLESSSSNNWQDALNKLERELAAYRHAMSNGATEEEIAAASAQVAAAMRQAQVAPALPEKDAKDLPPLYQSPPIQLPNLPSQQPQPAPPIAPSPSTIRPNKLRRDRDAPQPILDLDGTETSSTKVNPAKQMGRGLLIILVTPVAAAGMCIYAGGLVVEGISLMLKGLGSAGKKPLEHTLKGMKKGRRS